MQHINEFTIHRFRGVQDVKLEELGQINLLVGVNNSGKTSVLEALSIFCDPLSPRKWSSVAVQRETSSSLSRIDRLLWLFPQGKALITICSLIKKMLRLCFPHRATSL